MTQSEGLRMTLFSKKSHACLTKSCKKGNKTTPQSVITTFRSGSAVGRRTIVTVRQGAVRNNPTPEYAQLLRFPWEENDANSRWSVSQNGFPGRAGSGSDRRRERRAGVRAGR